MAISVDQIDLWRQVPTETEILEFKEAKNQFDNKKLALRRNPTRPIFHAAFLKATNSVFVAAIR